MGNPYAPPLWERHELVQLTWAIGGQEVCWGHQDARQLMKHENEFLRCTHEVNVDLRQGRKSKILKAVAAYLMSPDFVRYCVEHPLSSPLKSQAEATIYAILNAVKCAAGLDAEWVAGLQVFISCPEDKMEVVNRMNRQHDKYMQEMACSS